MRALSVDQQSLLRGKQHRPELNFKCALTWTTGNGDFLRNGISAFFCNFWTLTDMDRSHSQSMIDFDTNMDQLHSDYKLNAG